MKSTFRGDVCLRSQLFEYFREVVLKGALEHLEPFRSENE